MINFIKKAFGVTKTYTKEEIDNKFKEFEQNYSTTHHLQDSIKSALVESSNRTLKIVNKSPNPYPVYANIGDSGMDLRAWIKEDEEDVAVNSKNGKRYITLKSLERRLVHTGIYMGIPEDCEVQVRPRSGLALKQGLSVCNTPGTVDSNYVNEVGIIAINLSKKPIIIEDGDKIAQAVLTHVYNSNHVRFEIVDKIEENEYRNMNGFGSSGVK